MGNSSMKQHFENAKKTGVLKISNQRLQEFPPPLKQLDKILRNLDLSDNRFQSLPNEIGNFTLLKHLNVSNNRLASLPESLGNLVKLESLTAVNNLITTIPMSLGNLKNLKQVNLSGNQIQHFPVMLCGLPHLDVLDLSKNKIVVIPEDIKTLNVTELNLNQNQISVVSDAISECPRMKTLRLEENCLQIEQVHPKILKESKICNLTLDGNLFENKQFTTLEGYEIYMERYTAVKKKMF